MCWDSGWDSLLVVSVAWRLKISWHDNVKSPWARHTHLPSHHFTTISPLMTGSVLLLSASSANCCFTENGQLLCTAPWQHPPRQLWDVQTHMVAWPSAVAVTTQWASLYLLLTEKNVPSLTFQHSEPNSHFPCTGVQLLAEFVCRFQCLQFYLKLDFIINF